ncbi:uncharacterized protein RCC_08786 [Ramularia collo-cygni]|uniref:Uncharacterized protein n=1 Tax=Ramularia collo-cygni TaxID=112498 RepID=A0A2D3V113_9PEZI|nr:uncharacterized protein RCC_08786 [Ramularia collo-cygni]CZT23076.1 uncharacterized protein RCC_08786 [Ramularia collo-cygni]
MTEITAEELRAGLARLPRLLQDRIRDNTLRITPGITTINQAYKPPIQLSINHAIRERAASIYYGGSQIWKFAGRGSNSQHLFAWLRTLSHEDLGRLQDSLRPDPKQAENYGLYMTRMVIRGEVFNVAIWSKKESNDVFVLRGLLLARDSVAVGSYPVGIERGAGIGFGEGDWGTCPTQ